MRKKLWVYGPYLILGAMFLLLVVLNAFYLENWLDSDMAAEMVFSRLLAEGKHIFATPDWYYSTEFRFLYTHLIMGPLFRILGSWHVIRMITNIVFYALLIASYFYFMKPLGVSRRMTALTAAILLMPFSETMMLHMQMGNTYMSHVIIQFFIFGMFLRLIKQESLAVWKSRLIMALYVLLSLICGISGVRYMMAVQCPLLVASLLYVMKSEEFQSFRKQMTKENRRRLFGGKTVKYLYYSMLSVIGCIVGYGINVIVLSRQYIFQSYNETNFIEVYQGELFTRLQDAIGSLIMLFGYIPNKGVISLRGIVTLVSIAFMGIIVYCAVKSYKNSSGSRFFVVLFFVVSLLCNGFILVFTSSTQVPRYYIMPVIFMLPVFAIYFEKEKIPFDKWAVGLLLGACLFLSTAKMAYSLITVDRNEERYPVADFLVENGYTFGYATFNNANIMTELSNGRIEIANIGDPQYLEPFKWSSPVRYYEEGYYNGQVFLLLTAEEAKDFAGTATVRTGLPVYEDENYVVLLYASTEQLMECADVRE